MGYINKLRQYVGHDELIMTCGSVIIVNKKNEILLQLREDDNTYSYFGGAVELGESVEEAAIREVKEECGLDIEDLEFFKISSGKEAYHVYPNGDKVFSIDIIYICRVYHGDLVPQIGESKKLDFFAEDNFPSNIIESKKKTFAEYFKKYKR